jgi:hypothetical protein
MDRVAKPREIRAVRKVLYDRKRMRKLVTEARSIDVLMNTDPYASLDSDDVRVTAGAGPIWFVPGTGEIDPGVLEAADRCRRIATLLRQIRRELADVDFDADDKRHLREALDEHAKAWVARAEIWSRPQRPSDPAADAAEISRHDAKATRNYAKVKAYLDRDAAESVL